MNPMWFRLQKIFHMYKKEVSPNEGLLYFAQKTLSANFNSNLGTKPTDALIINQQVAPEETESTKGKWILTDSDACQYRRKLKNICMSCTGLEKKCRLMSATMENVLG